MKKVALLFFLKITIFSCLQAQTWSTVGSCAGAPTIHKVVVDACSNDEGWNEFFTFTTGSTSVSLSSVSIEGTTAGPPLSNNFAVAPASILNALNTAVGACTPAVFQAPPAGTIPPNSKVIAFISSHGITMTVPNLSTYCGQGPIYVISGDYPSSGGFLLNQPNASCPSGALPCPKTIKINLAGCTFNISYDVRDFSNTASTEGSYVAVNAGGTTTNINGNGNCFPAYPVTCTNPVGNANLTSVNATGLGLNCNNNVTALNISVLPAQPAGTTYKWSGPGITSANQNNASASITDPTVIGTAGTKAYTVTITNVGGCSIVSNSNTIFLKAAPTFVPIADLTLCTGVSVPYTILGAPTAPSAGATYLWTSTTAPTSIAPAIRPPSQSSITVTPIAPLFPSITRSDTYSVTVTETNGCTWTDNFKIDVYPPPALPVVITPLTVCEGSPITLTVKEAQVTWPFNSTVTFVPFGVNIVWTGPNSFSNTTTIPAFQAAPFSTNVTSPLPGVGTHTYSVTGELANITGPPPVTLTGKLGCKSAVASVSVTVTPKATTTLNTATTCKGASLSLNTLITAPLPAPSGIWSGIGVSGSTFNSSALAAGSYSVTFTPAATECAGTQTTTITVQDAPTSAPTQTGNICGVVGNYTGTTTLNVGGDGTGFTWDAGVTGSGNSVTVSTPGTYKVTITNATPCSIIETFTVVATPNPTVSVLAPSVLCAGGNTTLALNTIGTISTYNWDDGTATPTRSVSSPGTYQVTVIDSKGCVATNSVTIAAGTTLTPTFTPFGQICGTGTVTLALANNYDTYLWDDNSINPTRTVNGSGAYKVTVTNTATGCQGVGTANVVQNAIPTFTIDGSLTVCPGKSTSLSTTPTFSSYNWSTGASSSSISVANPIAYGVTVTDANGCTASRGVTLNTHSVTPVIINGNNPVCVGAQTTLSLNPSTGLSQTWSNGQNTPTIIVGQGNYTAVVTDNNGCTVTTPNFSVSEDMITTAITGNTNVCQGSSTVLGVTGSFNNYRWSTGENAPSIVVGVGNYTVTVTNANGCTQVRSTTVNTVTPPAITINGSNSYCTGNPVSLSVTPAFAAYIWSNGQNTSSITATGTGTYSVTATDNNGCTAIQSKNIIEYNNPTPTIAGSTSICAGQNTTLSAGIYQSYSWSNLATTSSIQINQVGPISVTVTDLNGCKGTATTTINSNASLIFNISGTPSFCEGGSTTLDAGSGFVSYLWDNGATTQTVNANQAKEYKVTVSNGICNGEAKVTVVENQVASFTITGKTDFCENESVTLSTSVVFASYNWSNSGLNQTTTASNSGNYTVTVTDNNGCEATKSLTVTRHSNPTPTITGITNICVGDSTKLTVNPSFVNYVWSNNETTQSFFAKAIQLYSVTVTDNFGCKGSASTNLSKLPDLKPTIVGKTAFCEGETVDIVASAGFGAYKWSSGENTAKITIDKGGTYVVTVSNGACTGVDSIKIIQNNKPIIKISKDTAICEGQEATLKADAGNAIYEWSSGEITPFISKKTAGKYIIKVTTPQGCTNKDSLLLTVNTLPKPIIDGQSTICQGETTVLKLAESYSKYTWSGGQTTPTINVNSASNYFVTVTNTAGCTATTSKQVSISNSLTPFIIGKTKICAGDRITISCDADYNTYLWSNGLTTKSIEVNQPGSYKLTVTSVSGCSGEASVTVQKATDAVATIVGSKFICGSNPTTLDAGLGFKKYTWTNGDTTRTIKVNTAGNYAVTVSNTDGCVASATIFLIKTNPESTLKDTLCFGESRTINGKKYDENNASGKEIIVKGAQGGCDSIIDIKLYFRPQIKISLIGSPASCNGNAVDLTVNVIGYTGAFDFTYSDDAGIQKTVIGANNGDKISITPTKNTTYSIVSTSIVSANCTVELGKVTITLGNLAYTKQINDIKCFGDKNGSIALTPTTGTAPYVYTWSNGVQGAENKALVAGKYSVTLSDAAGCSAIEIFELREPTKILAKAETKAASCKGGNGEIIVTEAKGGNGDFSYSLNGRDFLALGGIPFSIKNIAEGNYTLTIRDGNDCVVSQNAIVLSSKDALKIELGPDQNIGFGDSLVLTPTAGFQMKSLKWTPSTSLSCDTCQFVIAYPKATTTYRVAVTDENGCTATDNITLIVNKLRNVYIPNSFSPNADGNNDLLRVYLGDGTLKVDIFRIFDRWGNMVYQDLDYNRAESQEQNRGWNGNFRGQQLVQSIYTYHVRVTFIDGEIFDYKGDVMLIRE